MAFFLKKLISIFLMPLSIGLILAFIGLYFLYKNRIKQAKIFLSLSFAWLVIVSYIPFSYMLIEPLEKSYPKLEKPVVGVKHILLLGGNLEARGWEALRLYNKIDGAIVVTSGFEKYENVHGAKYSANFLREMGIKQEDIVEFNFTRDTQDEIVEMKKRFGDVPFYLVTSAFHMPRAMALCKKEGAKAIASPTAYKDSEHNTIFSLPSPRALWRTTVAWHEYIGLLYSKLRGYI